MRRTFFAALALFTLAACNESTSPTGGPIGGFTLLDAATDTALATSSLADGMTLDATGLPATVRVRADVAPDFAGSVRFTLGDLAATDSSAPYTLEGWTPATGSYTLTATPYSGPDGAGTAGAARSVGFTVTEAGTAEPLPEGYRRLLYVVGRGSPNLLVYDMDDNYKLVKSRTVRELQVSRTWGAVAHAESGVLYLSHHNRDGAGGTISPGILAYDLVADKVLWRKTYKPFVDSLEITPDGKTIYMATGEASSSGDFWFVIDAATGDVKDTIPVFRGAHNTIVSPDGSHVYMGSVRYPYLVVADTATNDVVREIGPFRAGVRPFTVNGAETLAFVNVNQFLGFEVGDVATGKKLYSVPVEGYRSGPFDEELDVQSHGVALTPDEREVWVVDSGSKALHTFDVTGLPTTAPVQKDTIQLAGNPVWIAFSRDGRFAHVSTGDVVDTTTRQIVAKTVSSKIRLQIDFVGDEPVRAYSRYGLGYVTPN